MNKKALALLLCGGVLFAPLLTAEETVGWYGGVQLSGVEVDDIDLEVDQNGSAAAGAIGPGDHELSTDTGTGINLILGYDVPGILRYELELKHNQNEIEETELEDGTVLNPDPLEGEDANATFLLGNLYLDLMPDEPLSPYFGIGIGGADLDTADDIVAAAQVGVGFSWAVSEAVKMDFGYRYMMTEDGDIDVDGEEEDVSTSYEAQSINVGIRYAFDALSAGGNKARRGGGRLDSDGDGVSDRRDRCSATPLGANIDQYGCPSDADADGVYDGIDSCNGTPRGTPVDPFGCAESAAPARTAYQAAGPDRDGDGVADGEDACPGTRGAAVLSNGCGSGQGLRLDVTFASGSARLSIPAQTKLYKLWLGFRNDRNFQAEIQGHTDNVGSPSLNRSLSQKRAESVMDFFVQLGVPARNLSARGYGSSQPVASNASTVGRAENRRVEMVIR